MTPCALVSALAHVVSAVSCRWKKARQLVLRGLAAGGGCGPDPARRTRSARQQRRPSGARRRPRHGYRHQQQVQAAKRVVGQLVEHRLRLSSIRDAVAADVRRAARLIDAVALAVASCVGRLSFICFCRGSWPLQVLMGTLNVRALPSNCPPRCVCL